MTEAKPIGIVGLGLMGMALGERLTAAGHSVLGFDIDPDQAGAIENIGGGFAGSLSGLARQCDLMFIAVFDTDQVEAVTETEILPAVGEQSGKILLCVSTCDPDRIAALAARLEKRGLYFVEAPVSGTSEQVRRGEGVGLVGGDAVMIAKAHEVLAAVFPRYFHLGAAGNGGRAKLAINLILGLNRLALAEGLVFAERMGLEPKAFLDVARKAASYSQVMDTKALKMVAGDFSPQGRARQTLKDVRLMLDQAGKLGQELPLASLNAEILEACLRNGEGEADNSVVISEIRRRSKS
jgi:3-hydroxyisobutyrate dehydrogenase-like beta-hydroxyacid dehydrogenase